MKKKTNTDDSKKDVIAELKDEFKRHTTVLMEHMTKEVKTVAEGHSGIIKKLEEHDKRFDKFEGKLLEHDKKFAKTQSELHSISMAVMDTNQTLKSMEKRFDNHESRITKLEEKAYS